MKIKLEPMTLTLLAALGLAPACAVRPLADGDGESSGSGDGDGDSGSESASSASTSVTGDGDGDAETGEPPEPYMCDGAQDILQANTDLWSGFVMCADGFIHRPAQQEAFDPAGEDAPECALDEFGSCNTAADCVDQPYGRCVNDEWGGCLCTYGCASDSDCNPGFACAPSPIAGNHATCIPADCQTDADCGDGLCGLSVYEGCCGLSYQLACASPVEECHVDGECEEAPCNPDFPDGSLVMYQCAVQSDGGVDVGEWTCKPPGWCECDCGRPYFVDGEARVAPTRARGDWCSSVAPAVDALALDTDTRAQLIAHWTRVGQFEHASVASFARFAMQLLQLGAPPQLLKDTARALGDEIEHARLSFALASAYAGRPIGPAGLDVAGDQAAGGTGVREIVEGLIVEACVGETLAAIEAREAALWAEDPVVASLLERIADDEWRHAQLGWRALAWVLEQGDASLRAFARSRFDAAIAAIQDDMPAGADLRAHGLLGGQLRAQLRAAGVREVIEPCVAALRRVAAARAVA